MAGLTRNLKLRLADDLTADARYNLERIDQLGSVFPLGTGSSQRISSSGEIRLEPNATSLGGDGNGNVLAPNLKLENTLTLESGAYSTTITAGIQTSNISLTLPTTRGASGQFLRTDGSGALSWANTPAENLATLNDTSFTDLQANDVLQYNGSVWVNASPPSARQTGTFVWAPEDGVNKTITHNFNTDKVQVWIYDTQDKKQVFIEGIDYLDSNTILLSAHKILSANYIVHLIQTT